MKWVLLVFMCGCVGPAEMEACKSMCAPNSVQSATMGKCECFPPSLTRDGGR